MRPGPPLGHLWHLPASFSCWLARTCETTCKGRCSSVLPSQASLLTCYAGMLLQEPHTADPVSFTHVLIDEAGQVIIASCCIPSFFLQFLLFAAQCPSERSKLRTCPHATQHSMPALNAHMLETAAVCMPQALLPEALIPLSLLMPASSAGQVGVAAAGVAAAEHKGWGAVLCGDPRQLGPVVRSHVSLLASCCRQTAATHAVHAAHCWACCVQNISFIINAACSLCRGVCLS